MSRLFEPSSKGISGSNVFQGNFKGVPRKFSGCIYGVSRVFQESFKGVSMKLAFKGV